MTARKFLDLVKMKVDIRTDKELAEEMGVKYTSVTSALARDSIQYELIIKFLLRKGVDLNEVFSILLVDDSEIDLTQWLNQTSSSAQSSAIDDAIEEEAEIIAKEIKTSYIKLADNCTIKELRNFKNQLLDVLNGIHKPHDE